MPYHTVSKDEKLGVIAFSGSVSGAEIRAAMQSIAESTDWQGLHVLWDFRTVRHFVFVPEDLHAILTLSHALDTTLGEGKSAIITSPDVDPDVIALLAKRLQQDAGQRRIFHSTKEALSWIGTSQEVWSDEKIGASGEVAHPK